jgi:hypothetical protein
VEENLRFALLSVADHQQLKATPPERAKWVTVGMVSGFAFALAALLVTVTLRLHSFYARKLLQVRVSHLSFFRNKKLALLSRLAIYMPTAVYGMSHKHVE